MILRDMSVTDSIIRVEGDNGEDKILYDTDNNSSENDVSHTVYTVIGIILGVLILLYLIRKFVQGGWYLKKNRIDGKVVIITGCNTGIGKETVLELAKRGAKIYMACRDTNKCEAARLEIIEKSKNDKIYNRTLDLASLASIKQFAEKFKQEETRLDILINNAGIMAPPKMLTKDGFESQIGVNHLGHFYLTNLLLDLLKSSAPSRIVVVSSIIYLIGRINKNDLNSDKSYNRYLAYAQSKLANILFTRQLTKLLNGTGVTVNCCHPGVVRTNLGYSFFSDWLLLILRPLTIFFCKTALAGAQTTIKLAIDPDLETVTGQYYSDCLRFPLMPHARNTKMAEWLWHRSEELTGLIHTNIVEEKV